jgi:hypothetical protein
VFLALDWEETGTSRNREECARQDSNL